VVDVDGGVGQIGVLEVAWTHRPAPPLEVALLREAEHPVSAIFESPHL
jgi:hypothetical protein